jgi:hypothetical protein
VVAVERAFDVGLLVGEDDGGAILGDEVSDLACVREEVPLEEMGSSLALSSAGRTKTRFSMVLNLFSRMLEGSLGISASSDDWHPPIAVIIINYDDRIGDRQVASGQRLRKMSVNSLGTARME